MHVIIERRDKVEEPREFETDRLSIGSLSQNDLLLNHASVADHHADIISDEKGHWLVPLQGKNNVLINERVISEDSILLHDGDRVRIGTFLLIIHLHSHKADSLRVSVESN